MKNLLFLAVVTGLLMAGSCTKKTTTPTNPNTIFYTVQVVSGVGLIGKNTGTQALSGATVATNQNGKVTTVTTDASGLATFTLNPGIVAVTVSASNQTTLNYLAQLNYSAGSSTCYNSTMAAIFPTSGNGTSTITGRATARLNDTTGNKQNVPDGTGVNAYIVPGSNLQNYVNPTTGQGQILQVSYESAAFRTTVSGGSYTLTLPATADGLSINLTGDEFDYNVVINDSTTQRQIFNTTPQAIISLANQKLVRDINY